MKSARAGNVTQWPWLHPVLFAVVPALMIWGQNASQVGASSLLGALAGCALLALLLRFAASRWVWPAEKAALWTTVLIIGLFSFGISIRVARKIPGLETLAQNEYLAAVVHTSALVLVLVALPRLRLNWAQLTVFANIVALVLVLTSIGRAVAALQTNRPSVTPAGATEATTRWRGGAKPDFYYIILDGYGGDVALRDIHGYNNSPFVAELERRGFYVARDARPNYGRTFLSLTSALNLDYLQQFGIDNASFRNAMPRAKEMIRTSRVARLFKANGYRYVHISSSAWSFSRESPLADVNRVCAHLDELHGTLLRYTVLKVFELDLAPYLVRGGLCQFKAAVEASVPEQPTFTFVHVLSPHPPYLFHADGSPVRRSEWLETPGLDIGGQWNPSHLYIGQLQYVNARVLEMVDRLIAGTSREAVIILQGDHGPWSLHQRHLIDKASNGTLRTEEQPTFDRMMQEIFSILYAVRGPGMDSAGLYPTMSPINGMRRIVSQYFDLDLPRLADRSYITREDDPAPFIDVTTTVTP